ncbi:N-terminal C2 in EEIG1 and EHBP1 proteins-domain-containing protein [Lipomyces japonicus]|uniref:N-terminal C2 in EEIG1 and EHBP1 proteins-domain-containing protein n=1 Tax=Lipomyces japonicus TaxID=56871 RepID=UPI0034CEBC9F
MQNVLIPKSRRTKFAVKILIHDLTNIPLVSGVLFVRWHVRDAGIGSSEARGRTDKVPIKEHKAVWNYEWQIEKIRMVIDRDGMLQDKMVMFEVVSQHAGEKVELGTLQVNMAEYVKEESTGRRYLLQNSKINSTLKIQFIFKQLSGDSNFATPPLTSGQVFVGITGVIADQKDNEALLVPSALTVSEQSTPSLYRKTLTASWQRQDGELTAEECVEDIFAGGDGWSKDSNGISKGRHLIANLRKEEDIGGTVPGAGVAYKRKNGEVMGWAERDNLRSWKYVSS